MKPNTLTAAGESHKGIGRSRNDDRFIIRNLQERTLLVGVSDGMGGHPAGHLAAETVISCLRALNLSNGSSVEQLTNFVYQAEKAIQHRISQEPRLEGMGATVTAVLIDDTQASWVHVGDCRLYLIRNEVLHQVSRDHTFLQDLIDEGDITLAEAGEHPMSHVLDQCVGCMDTGPERGKLELFPGDILLVCTDGLYKTVPENQIIDIANRKNTATGLVRDLLAISRQAKGRDDATAIVALIT